MANPRYIKKVEEKVKELMSKKPKKKKQVKGLLESRKEDDSIKSMNVIDVVAGHVADIRKKRMELKNGK